MISYKVNFDKYLQELSKNFDVFITCKNNESRSTRSEEILKENSTSIRHTIVVSLNNTGTIKTTQTNGIYVVDVPFDNLIDGVPEIMKAIKQFPELSKETKFLIDISSFIKPYFFVLLKSLLKYEQLKNIFVVYTEPKSYVKNTNKKYSFHEGTKMISEIPGFGYHESQDKKRLLIITLGFEGERASEIHASVDPDSTMAINGLPSYVLDYKDQSMLFNKDFLVSANCYSNLKRASASDPLEVYQELNEIYDYWKDSHNITIAPLGTKPMALGIALFAIMHEDVRVVFSFPTTYYPNQPSKDFGKTWLYKIKY